MSSPIVMLHICASPLSCPLCCPLCCPLWCFRRSFENHKTDTAYENSLVLKTAAFQCVNNFSGLFYMAFVQVLPHLFLSQPGREAELCPRTWLGAVGGCRSMAPWSPPLPASEVCTSFLLACTHSLVASVSRRFIPFPIPSFP